MSNLGQKKNPLRMIVAVMTNKYVLILYAVFLFITLIPNFLPFQLENVANSESRPTYDRYEARLSSKLNSMDELERYLDSSNLDPQSIAYWNNAATVLRKRFYHSFSAYSLDENWLAAVAGYAVPSIYFQYPVQPAEVVEYEMAGCSQQGIVLQTLMNRKGINYKTVGFNHHYAVAGEIDGKWFYFDTNIEPEIDQSNRPTVGDIKNQSKLREIYPQFSEQEVKNLLGPPRLSVENIALAPNMSLFHTTTYWLSRTLWIIPFGLLLIGLYLRSRGSSKVDKEV